MFLREKDTDTDTLPHTPHTPHTHTACSRNAQESPFYVRVAAAMFPRGERSALERRDKRQRAGARHAGWAYDQLVAHRSGAATHQLDSLEESFERRAFT